jgi:hypothetical protein
MAMASVLRGLGVLSGLFTVNLIATLLSSPPSLRALTQKRLPIKHIGVKTWSVLNALARKRLETATPGTDSVLRGLYFQDGNCVDIV